jgi:hypothetical protein
MEGERKINIDFAKFLKEYFSIFFASLYGFLLGNGIRAIQFENRLNFSQINYYDRMFLVANWLSKNDESYGNTKKGTKLTWLGRKYIQNAFKMYCLQALPFNKKH